MDLQKIGAYIAAKRKALGMTQTELAESKRALSPLFQISVTTM